MARHIMVFNDDQDTLEMYGMILEYEGYKPFLFIQTEVTFQDIDSVSPELIILDCLYGREQLGLDVLQQIETYSGTSNVPVIVCTAATEDVMRQYEVVFDKKDISLVYKPFELNDFTSLVALRLPHV